MLMDCITPLHSHTSTGGNELPVLNCKGTDEGIVRKKQVSF